MQDGLRRRDTAKTVPLPPGDQEIYGVSQDLQTTPLPADMKDPEFLERQIISARIGIEDFKTGSGWVEQGRWSGSTGVGMPLTALQRWEKRTGNNA